MSIKRNSCRISERKRMRILQEKGMSIPQISNAVSVRENIVEEVLSGRWAEAEAVGKKQLSANNEARSVEKENEKINEAAAIAAATVQALKAVESAELSPQQRGAITRRANEAREAAENPAENAA